MKIAGCLTDKDWKERKPGLVVGGDEKPWKRIFDDFFLERLKTRYLGPVEAIQSLGKNTGEGFSIVAIHCSLIEFLGATLEGKSYRYNPGKKLKLGEFEYDGSKVMFISFLITAPPFKAVFDEALAKDFYEGVRNGLLHEARTKNGWKIRTRRTPGPFIEKDTKIVWRDDLQRAFGEFIKWYRAELPKNKSYQEAFIRKFDALCEP